MPFQQGPMALPEGIYIQGALQACVGSNLDGCRLGRGCEVVGPPSAGNGNALGLPRIRKSLYLEGLGVLQGKQVLAMEVVFDHNGGEVELHLKDVYRSGALNGNAALWS